MRIPPRIGRVSALGALSLTLLVGGPAALAQANGPAAHTPAASAPAAVAPLAVGEVCLSALPAEAHHTLDLIEQGGPYPYPQDGTVFENREGLLPDQNTGYYHEYTVETPGSPDRGARRIVTGEEQEEDYYTKDHYESFDKVDHAC
ncbi:MAG: ribonuclease [Streptomyces sp.]|uniref:ribonuclease n=1 Tax=Streptomyces sp. TaxID=1931 RepID=UPI003D6AA16A